MRRTISIRVKPWRWWLRWSLRLALALALLAAGVWGYFWWDEAQALKAWEGYRAEAEKRGVKFELRDFIKPEIPAEENFAASVLFQPQAQGARRTNPFTLPDYYLTGDWRKKAASAVRPGFGVLRNEVENWRICFEELRWIPKRDPTPTPELLWKALGRYDVEWSEFLQAAAKPRARFLVGWEKGSGGIDYQPFHTLQILARFIVFRAQIRLVQSQAEEAISEWRHLRRLERALDGEMGISGVLVKQGLQVHEVTLLRQGLELGAWTDDHLREIEEAIGAMDPLADYFWGVTSERAMVTNDFVSFLHLRERYWSDPETTIRQRLWSVYHGLLAANHDVDHALGEVDVAAHRFTCKDNEGFGWKRSKFEFFNEQRYRLYDWMGRNFRAIGLNAAYTATLLDQARVVIALERFRRARGNYPDVLDAVTPGFLTKVPHDVLDGQPLHYRRAGEKFLLYSVGPNLKDDGGTSKNKFGEVLDWVWGDPAVK